MVFGGTGLDYLDLCFKQSRPQRQAKGDAGRLPPGACKGNDRDFPSNPSSDPRLPTEPLSRPSHDTTSQHRANIDFTMTLPSQTFDVDAFLAKVGEGRSIQRFDKEQVIYAQGDRSDAVYYIQSGNVKATVLSDQGKEAVLALHGPDDFFGEACLTMQTHRLATTATIEEAVIMRLEKASVVRVIHDESEFSEMFIAHLLTRSIRLEADLIDQMFNSSEKRLARLLLLLAKYARDEEPKMVIENMSQETLAQMIGTTRARVSSFMNKFRKLGFIDYNNGGIVVNSSLLNMVLLDPTDPPDQKID